MSGKGEGGHLGRITIRIDWQTHIDWLKGQQEAQHEVSAACRSWLQYPAHAHGLSEDAVTEVTQSAMTDAWIETTEENLSYEDSLRFLQQRLNTGRAALRRGHQRHESLSGSAQDLKAFSAADFEEKILLRDFLDQTIRLVEHHMPPALLSLSTKDHDILVVAYGLQEEGDPLREPVYPEFPTLAAERKAISRARLKLNKHLESLLVAELETINQFDRQLYEAALAFVRGGTIFAH